MTRDFRNAAACAIFVVKSDTLFLEQVFTEFEQLLELFRRIFLVVNVDSPEARRRPRRQAGAEPRAVAARGGAARRSSSSRCRRRCKQAAQRRAREHVSRSTCCTPRAVCCRSAAGEPARGLPHVPPGPAATTSRASSTWPRSCTTRCSAACRCSTRRARHVGSEEAAELARPRSTTSTSSSPSSTAEQKRVKTALAARLDRGLPRQSAEIEQRTRARGARSRRQAAAHARRVDRHVVPVEPQPRMADVRASGRRWCATTART